MYLERYILLMRLKNYIVKYTTCQKSSKLIFTEGICDIKLISHINLLNINFEIYQRRILRKKYAINHACIKAVSSKSTFYFNLYEILYSRYRIDIYLLNWLQTHFWRHMCPYKSFLHDIHRPPNFGVVVPFLHSSKTCKK